MAKLLPDQLKDLWQSVTEERLTAEDFSARQETLLDEYRKVWKEALLFNGHSDLQQSILSELARYVECADLTEIQRRCIQAVDMVKGEWTEDARQGDRQAIVEFYDKSQAMIYELMWWHTLADDVSPLAYVTALDFAKEKACRRYLDFGSGVGAGGLLFGRHGFDISLADISSPLLRFCQWRLGLRKQPGRFIDLKTAGLPKRAFDLITAMDVFEHLADPARTVEELGEALAPGGYLFARLHAEFDEQRPQHIVQDFGPTFRRLDELGFVEVWRDEWLWGHQVFQRP
jgi:SAM-dependent methyltransferase